MCRGVDMMPFPPEVIKHLQKNERVDGEQKVEVKGNESEIVMGDRNIKNKEFTGEFTDESRKRAFYDINEEVMDDNFTFDYDMISQSGNRNKEIWRWY